MVESVDTRDLKSLAGNSVPVQVWPRVPLFLVNSKKASTLVGAFLQLASLASDAISTSAKSAFM